MNPTIFSEKPSLKEALQFWLKLGFISFGGPAGQVAIMHEFLVEKKKWISESKFMHALNYCMVLPGPEAQQLATYIGWLLHGRLGGLAAGILFVLPSMFILLGLSILYVTFGNIPWIYALFNGLKPAVIAIIILALIKIGKKSLLSYFHYSVALVSFIGIFFFNIPFPILILTAVIVGLAIQKWFPKFLQGKSKTEKNNAIDESEYLINNQTILPETGFSTKRLFTQISTTLLLWALPLVAFALLVKDFEFWKNLSVFFTKAALVTFGGAYAVLPYVAQVSVEKFHWLSSYEMIDGLALGETTPGPLIMVLVFVGFMGAYNHYDSVAWGSLGLLTTTFYTFLPCFLFILAGAPIIEKTQENQSVKRILSFVTAAVVGVILNLTLYLSKAVLFPKSMDFLTLDYISLIWVVISFLALHRFKINMILWIGISAVFGVVRYFLLG
jgi:chromate transporter